MKKKTVNKFKRAGIWNIACGVLTTLAYIGFFVCLIVASAMETVPEEELGAGIAVFTLLFGFVGAYLWEAVMIFPFFMILTGAELCSKHKKGAGVRILIVFNIFLKLLCVFLNGFFGVGFFAISTVMGLCGAFLLLTAILTLVSVILDFPALVSRNLP